MAHVTLLLPDLDYNNRKTPMDITGFFYSDRPKVRDQLLIL